MITLLSHVYGELILFIIWQASLPVKWRTVIGREALSAVHYFPVMEQRSIT